MGAFALLFILQLLIGSQPSAFGILHSIMYQQCDNLLNLVLPTTATDTDIHTFQQFKDWINNSFAVQSELNPLSHISKTSEVKTFKARKGQSFGIETTQSHRMVNSLTKRLSISYNALNQIQEREQTMEQSVLPQPHSNAHFTRKSSFGGQEIARSRKSSYAGELGFDLKEHSVRSHSAHSSISVNGLQQINQYELVEKLGTGTFADVFLAVDTTSPNQDKYAVKVLCSKHIKKRLLLKKNSQMLHAPPPPDEEQEQQHVVGVGSKPSLANMLMRNQVAILKKMNHPYITKLYDVIIDNDKGKVYLVLEYCSGGFINQNRSKENKEGRDGQYLKLLQSECRRYMKQLVQALDYIHNVAKIAHRDIKPENILLNQEKEVKLSDFGLGTHKLRAKNTAGTLLYMPPETEPSNQEEVCTKAGDIWATGVTLLVMLTARHPDFHDGKINVQKEIGKLKDVSETCRDFILRCLQIDSQKRAKAQELLQHKWLGGQVVKNEQQCIVVTEEDQQKVLTVRRRKEKDELFNSFQAAITLTT